MPLPRTKRPLRSIVRPLALAAAVAAASLCVVCPAAAQSVAQTEFVEAKKRYDDGKFDEALQMFQLAWEHSHSPNARLYVAKCFMELGNYKAAYDEFRGTLRDAADKAQEDEKYLATRNAAAAELILLEPKIGRLIIAPDALVPDAKVTLDGSPVPAIRLGEPIAVEPGTKTITASADGRQDVSLEVGVAGGRVVAAPIVFPPVLDDGTVVVPPPPPEDEPLTALQIVGITSMAVGGATLVLAAVSGGAAASKHSALRTGCGGTNCSDPAFADVVDSGKLFEMLAYIGAGVGGAALIAGGAMFIWGGPSDGSDQVAGVTPLPEGGAVMSYGLSF